MNIPDNVLYPLQAAMEQWTDGRCIEAIDLECLLMFVLYVPKVLSQFGIRYCGHVCKRVHMQTRMTVKVIEDGVPQVVFITAKDTIGCMHRFLDLLEDDRLTWRPDRYPWN